MSAVFTVFLLSLVIFFSFAFLPSLSALQHGGDLLCYPKQFPSNFWEQVQRETGYCAFPLLSQLSTCNIFLLCSRVVHTCSLSLGVPMLGMEYVDRIALVKVVQIQFEMSSKERV